MVFVSRGWRFPLCSALPVPVLLCRQVISSWSWLRVVGCVVPVVKSAGSLQAIREPAHFVLWSLRPVAQQKARARAGEAPRAACWSCRNEAHSRSSQVITTRSYRIGVDLICGPDHERIGAWVGLPFGLRREVIDRYRIRFYNCGGFVQSMRSESLLLLLH